MPQEQKKSRMPQIGEAVFCIVYLIFDLVAAVIFFVNANGSQTLYLCSDKAGFITGENICIDGGMTRQMTYHNDFGWKLEE